MPNPLRVLVPFVSIAVFAAGCHASSPPAGDDDTLDKADLALLKSDPAAYGRKHYSMTRYLFVEDAVYVKRGNGFVASGRKAKPGFYTSTLLERVGGPHDFLKVPALDGYLAEHLTSAAPRGTLAGAHGLPVGTERVDKWYALPFDYVPGDLVALPAAISKMRTVLLRADAAQAFGRLVAAARRDGISLYAFSGHRTAADQRAIYLKRITLGDWRQGEGQRQTSVARPGHSEHMLGTTADVVGNDLKHAAMYSFANTPEARWLHRRCYAFGFVLSYGPDNTVPSGYIIETWHIRYIGPDRVAGWKRRHLAQR